mgnify:CR=1 FL=1
MKRLLVTLIIAFTCLMSGFAQADIKHVSAVYEYISDNPNETPEHAERIAIERAKQKAIEDRFGLDVSSVNSTFIHSLNRGEESKSLTNVFSIGENSVRGEWIETIKEQVIDKRFERGFWRVKVEVVGKARQKTKASIEIHSQLINNTHDRMARDVFYDGDDIYLRFSAPVDGSLCVYLVDEDQQVYCLLPYEDSNLGHYPIKANEDYLFFSEETDRGATEYTLNTQREAEANAIYVVFSPNNIVKAKDKKGETNWRNESLPRNLSYGDFLKWLSKNQTNDEQMVVKSDVITIRR